MNGDRKPPANIARQLRKEAGFGILTIHSQLALYRQHHVMSFSRLNYR